MKNIIILCLISYNALAQFEVTREGIEPIIVEVPELSDTIIYSRAREWVQMTYSNPREVLKGDIQNEYIRVDGYTSRFYRATMDIACQYSFIIEIKPEKYRLTFTPNRLTVDASPIMYSYPKSFFKKDGTVKSSWAPKKDESEAYMNGLALSLYNHITQTSTKSEW